MFVYNHNLRRDDDSDFIPAPYSSVTEWPSLSIELPDITHVPSLNPVALMGKFKLFGSHVVTPISIEPLQEFTFNQKEQKIYNLSYYGLSSSHVCFQKTNFYGIILIE